MMQKQVKSAIILTLAFFAMLAALAMLSGALEQIKSAQPILFAAGATCFIESIFLWLVGWAWLIRSRQRRFTENVLLGFGCVFAALTPIQLGADALRSVKMKEFFSVSYSETISASMAIKGIKFLLIALVASLSFFTALLNESLQTWIKAALLSGFAVVALAALLFLLPMKRGIGLRIAAFFDSLCFLSKHFKRLAGYFQGYSAFLQQIPKRKIALVFLLALFSIAFEFLAFMFSFLSANVAIPIYSAVILFSILSILERTPFLPRGIGAVEAFGIVFLSMQSFTVSSLSFGQIVSVIILFDSMRLIIPTIASLAVYYLFFQKKQPLDQA